MLKRLFSKIPQNYSLRNFLNYLSGEVSIKALGIIAIPIITRLLTPAEFGLVSIYTACYAVFVIIFPSNLQSCIRPRYLKSTDNFDTFLGTVVITSIVSVIILSSILVFNSKFLSGFLQIPNKLFILSIVASGIISFKEIYFMVLLAKDESKNYARLNFVFYFSDLLFTILLIILLNNDKFYGKPYSQLIISTLFLFYSTYKLNKIINWSFNSNFFKFAILYSLPLILHSVSHFVLAQFDRVIINQLLGNEETAFYSLAYSTSSLLMVVITAVNNAWVPYFFQKLNLNTIKGTENKLFFYSTTIFLCAFVLGLFGREIIFILAPEVYSKSVELIPILVLGNIFIYIYMLFVNYSFYSGRTLLIGINTILAGAINIISNYILIPKFGIMGAAYTTLISYISLFLLHFFSAVIFNRKLPLINITPVFKTLVIFISLYLAVNWGLSFASISILLPLKIIITILLVLFWLKKILVLIKVQQ